MDDIYVIFDHLRYHHENEVIEFKKAENSFSFEELGQYFSALSNEANLRNVRRAWLAFGIHNSTKEIIGTSYKDSETKLQKLKHDLSQQTTDGMTFREIHVLQIEGKRVLLFEIPAAPRGVPVSWQGHFYARNGESLVALSMEKYEEIRNQAAHHDWSGDIVPAATMDDLSPEAIMKAREEYKERNPRQKDDVDTWDDVKFLNKALVTKKGRITNTALLLLGKPESEYLLSPAVAKIRWNLRTVDNQDKDFEVFSIPFILSVTDVYNRIRNLKYRYLLPDEGLFPKEPERYEPFNIRELLNNCIAHQDYGKGARINVVEYEDDHLVFTNYGQFIPMSIESVVMNDAPEELYRNPFLVEAMRNLNMIDTQGGGIRKVFNYQRERRFPMPDYDLTGGKVKATLTGRVMNEDYVRILGTYPELSLSDIILLDRVQKHLPIGADDCKRLKEMGLVEGRRPNLYLSFKAAAATDNEKQKAQYIKNRSFDDEHFREMILSYLDTYKIATKSEIVELLKDKLSDTLNDIQKVKKISNLIQDLRRSGKIESAGYSKWKRCENAKHSNNSLN